MSRANAPPPSSRDNDSLRIADVAAPRAGTIGLTLCPGKVGPGRRHPWNRNLDEDLAAIASWGANSIVTMMESHELASYGVANLGALIQERFGPNTWLHLPILDCSVPDTDWEEDWSAAAPQLHEQLNQGRCVLIHCLGGLGRTGLVACRLLIERNLDNREALRRVRHARPGAIETREQERWVLRCAP